MISASQITFATIVLGPIAALVFWVWYRRVCGCWGMSISLVTGIIANGMTIVALTCVVANIVIASYHSSFPKVIKTANAVESSGAAAQVEVVSASKVSIDGSETTIFLALLYALIILIYVVHRSFVEAKSPTSQ